MKCDRLLVSCLILSIWANSPVVGQFPAKLDDDDPRLLLATVFFLEDFGRWVDGKVAASSKDKGKQLSSSAAKYLGTDEDSFVRVIAASRIVSQAIRKTLSEEGDATKLHGSAKIPPAILAELQAKRERSIGQAIEKMRADLPPVAWESFRRYANTTHKSGMKEGSVGESGGKIGVQSGK